MTCDRTLYPSFGALLEYPQIGKPFCARDLLARLDEDYPEAAKHLRVFDDQVSPMSLAEREVLYTRTFDVMPSCDPYVSSQLFGAESYQRGPLMAGMLEVYQAADLDCGTELPDHIGVVLRFAEAFADDEWEDLVRLCLWGSVNRMVSMLCPTPNPFSDFFSSVLRVFEADVPDVLTSPPDTPLRVLVPQNSEMGENDYA